MTMTLMPDHKGRRLDRNWITKRRDGAYYGWALRDIIANEKPRSLSHRDRMARAYWAVVIITVICSVAFGFMVGM